MPDTLRRNPNNPLLTELIEDDVAQRAIAQAGARLLGMAEGIYAAALRLELARLKASRPQEALNLQETLAQSQRAQLELARERLRAHVPLVPPSDAPFLHGLVYDEAGHALANYAVELLDHERVVLQSRTDAQGYFLLPPPRPTRLPLEQSAQNLAGSVVTRDAGSPGAFATASPEVANTLAAAAVAHHRTLRVTTPNGTVVAHDAGPVDLGRGPMNYRELRVIGKDAKNLR